MLVRIDPAVSLYQRRGDLLQSASYSIARMPGLRRPLYKFAPGVMPFGHELDHLTDEQLRERDQC